MKVGLVLERFDPHLGGLEHWTWQFARALTERGHEVHVIAFAFHPSSNETGVVQQLVAMAKSRLARAAALEARLRQLPLDVIHDMGVGWFADIFHPHGGSTIATWEHNLLRIPRWRQIRFWREKRYREMRAIEHRQHAKKDAIIVAVSEMVRRHLETLHHLPGSRVRLIYNGVDIERFAPAANATQRGAMRARLGLNGETVFLLLAHNLRLKNADALIRATGQLIASGADVHLVIAGGKKIEPYRKLAASVGAARRVTLLGPVDDPVPLYHASDVYVQPTWYDPCSLVTLEAWACGLPVITTRHNGASELMPTAMRELVVDDPADVNALAAAMKGLIGTNRRRELGEAARALALEHSFERQTEEFLALYHEVIGAKRRRPTAGL